MIPPRSNDFAAGFRHPKRGHWQIEMPPFAPPISQGPNFSLIWRMLGLALMGVWLLLQRSALAGLALLPLFGMAQLPIDYGAAPNDRTGTAWRTAFQRIQDNFTDLYSLQSRIINAGDVRFASQPTTEARVQAAITQAGLELASIVIVPAFMLPYDASLVTFNPSVQMAREGGDLSFYDVRAYGAAGNAVQDDYPSFVAAIAGAASGTGWALLGGVVWMPPGRYMTSAPIVLPVATQQGQVILRGAGMRFTYIYGTGLASNFASGIVRMGTSTPDAAGTSTNVTQYCGFEDFGVSGTVLTGGGNAVGVQLTEANYCWMRNIIIENLPNNSIGLYLLGSTVTGGLGTNTTAPHTRLCTFINVLSVTSKRPRVFQNADENSFYSCDFGVTPGLTASADSLFATEYQMGRSNRDYSCLLAGDTTALKTAYVGYKYGPPVNAAGTPNGGVSNNHAIDCVAEGFDIVAWNVADSSGNTVGNGGWIHPSIYNTAFLDGNTQKGQGFFFVDPFKLTGGPLNYHSMRPPYCDAIVISGATPDVAGSKLFAFSNGSPTNVTGFTNFASGEEKTFRLDANTTFVNSGTLRCPGGVNLVGAAHMICIVSSMNGTLYAHGVTQC